MTTLILTGRWNYCTQNAKMAHALPQDIAINKINFEYKLYKLCGLLGMTNYLKNPNQSRPPNIRYKC